jgi:hypothetical protein
VDFFFDQMIFWNFQWNDGMIKWRFYLMPFGQVKWLSIKWTRTINILWGVKLGSHEIDISLRKIIWKSNSEIQQTSEKDSASKNPALKEYPRVRSLGFYYPASHIYTKKGLKLVSRHLKHGFLMQYLSRAAVYIQN